MKKILTIALISFFALTSVSPVLAEEEKAEFYEQVYLTEKQALDMVFKGLDIEKKEIKVSSDQKKIIQKKLKRKLKEDKFTYYIGKKNNQEHLYAWILDEMGKHYPITFIVSLNKTPSVEQVAVMTYREKKGDAVKKSRFLNQFKNKTSQDPIEVSNDIVNVTGATISSWSISAGVKKALILTEELIKKAGK